MNMSLIDIEKRIANTIMGWFQKGKQAEEAVLDRAVQIEHAIEDWVKREEQSVEQTLTGARQKALDANARVNQLKAELQGALGEAADLHRAAVDAANAAVSKAEQDLAKYRTMAAAHAADAATQAAQVTTPPAPAADSQTPTT
jgi:chromosome segregation ATPase